VRLCGVGLSVYYGRGVSSVESFGASCFRWCRKGSRRAAAELVARWPTAIFCDARNGVGRRINWASLAIDHGPLQGQGRKSSTGIFRHAAIKYSKQNQICSLRRK
jgi:hypothetical protein